MADEYLWIKREAASILEYGRRHFKTCGTQFTRPPKVSVVDPLSCVAQKHIQGGLMESLCSMYSIIAKDGAKTQPSDLELRQIPPLYTRIKDLLNIYYRHQIFREHHHDLRLCDLPEPGIASYFLLSTGLTFLTHKTHLIRLTKLDPDLFRKVFFDSGEYPPEVHKLFQRYLEGRRPMDVPI